MDAGPNGSIRAISLVLGLLGLSRMGCHEHRADGDPDEKANRPDAPLLSLFKTYFAKDSHFPDK